MSVYNIIIAALPVIFLNITASVSAKLNKSIVYLISAVIAAAITALAIKQTRFQIPFPIFMPCGQNTHGINYHPYERQYVNKTHIALFP